MAYSAGFTPHPKISYIGAAPTGVASEAEYLEIGVVREVDVAQLGMELDAVLPPGLDIITAVAAGGGTLADRIEASGWRIELPGVEPRLVSGAVAVFLAEDEVLVERLTKNGRKVINARAAVLTGVVGDGASEAAGPEPCAILGLVVRHTTPVVRPDDVLTGLRLVADLNFPVPPRATRIAQGALCEPENAPAPAVDLPVTAAIRLFGAWIADPLAADHGKR